MTTTTVSLIALIAPLYLVLLAIVLHFLHRLIQGWLADRRLRPAPPQPTPDHQTMSRLTLAPPTDEDLWRAEQAMRTTRGADSHLGCTFDWEEDERLAAAEDLERSARGER